MRDFSNIHVLVLGDIFLDEYQFGECTRISPEAPVPVVNLHPSKTKHSLGGAGNVAANISSLGGFCTLACRLGTDTEGLIVGDLLKKHNIWSLDDAPTGYRTPKKTRVMVNRQQVVRLDVESKWHTSVGNWPQIFGVLQATDVVVISDYAKGYFSQPFVRSIIAAAKKFGKPVIVDPKPCNASFYVGADYLTPNVKEAEEMWGDYTKVEFESNTLITKGPKGMEYFGIDGSHIVRPTVAKEVFDVAGAGDTVVAAFALAIASKMPIEEAIDFANKAAGVVVGKQGTSTVTQDEIEKFSQAL